MVTVELFYKRVPLLQYGPLIDFNQTRSQMRYQRGVDDELRQCGLRYADTKLTYSCNIRHDQQADFIPIVASHERTP